jgi:mannose-1-phosphate guanylyltransferase/nucleoside phosphorylase
MVQSEMGTIGPGASLITVHKAIESLHPSAIIMVGIAFGINPQKQNIGEILVSRQLVSYEQQKIKEGSVVPRGDRVMASPRLLDLFRSGSLDWQGPKVHFGIVLSGEKLVASQTFRDGLLNYEPETIGGEMEGAGLYAASEGKVDWILVKAICDWGDGKKTDDYQTMAAQNAAEFVLHVLQQEKRPHNVISPFSTILKDYEGVLNVFFDRNTGAVFESGRDDGSPKFLFTEATGYAIKDFLLLYSLTGEKDYLGKAKKSAEWIRNNAIDPCGGVKTRYFFEKDAEASLADLSFNGRRIYSFDTAICLSGLVALYNITKDKSIEELCLKMGNFLVAYMVSEFGQVSAIYDAANDTIIPATAKWSQRFGAFHSKVAEALIDLYSVTQIDVYRTKAISICNETLKFQMPDGNFETSVDKTELHPHCYAAEGLLHVGQKTNNKEFVNAAYRAIEWALSKSENGEIPQVFHLDENGGAGPLARFRTDSIAQVLALAADMFLSGKLDKKYHQRMHDIALKLLEMKPDTDKYFRYGFYEELFNGKLESDTLSYWTNMFCLRALYRYFLTSVLAKTDLLILAGGVGSRCWPISSETLPKHLSLNLLGNRSLLQETLRRYTYNDLIQPNQIYILCSEAGRKQTWEQAKRENIPHENVIVEKEPNGTIPAVWRILDEFRQQTERGNDRTLIVSMADDVIEPYENFQQALITALFTSNENECIVSVGKPVEKNQAYDNRFGYMRYSKRINSYRCYQVDAFKEKPESVAFEELMQTQDNIAWEGGTVVVSEVYFRKTAQDFQNKGNLAEHLLSKATVWTINNNQPNVAVSIFDASTRFEDFGVPGQNLHKFFLGNEKYDLGSGNVCLGNPEEVQMLYCSNNLIIGDKLPMKLYGLNGYLIIDNSWTNTTVFMPLKNADKLPNLYRVLKEPEELKPFIVGGNDAALPQNSDTFARQSPNTSLKSNNGLLFAYNCNEKVFAERLTESISIFNRGLPEVEAEDFDNLYKKQLQDSKLVDHLIHVTALAEFLFGDEIHMSKPAKDMLRLLCLYHDFGGFLSDEKEMLEAEFVHNFQEISKLDRRLLDTRIINQLLEIYPEAKSLHNEELIGLMNDSVNSAVEFLKYRRVSNANTRDLILFLIQIQDAPGLFAGFRNNIDGRFGFDLEEVEKAYACFKIADHFSNGRWLWKRSKYYSHSNPEYQGFLRFDKGLIEDFPFTLSFTIDWFQKAQIKPNVYIDRLNNILSNENSLFRILLNKLEEGKANLTSDFIYCRIIASRDSTNKTEIEEIINRGINTALNNPKQLFQLKQIIELPSRLRNITLNSTGIDKNSVNHVAETTLKECQANKQQINQVARGSYNYLFEWEDLV